MSGRIGYLVPEFPGQTHTWIWRELMWLRRWGADIRLISTRPPPERDHARHAFAAAAAETADDGTSPPSDTNASADYRRQLARVLTRRALEEALSR